MTMRAQNVHTQFGKYALFFDAFVSSVRSCSCFFRCHSLARSIAFICPSFCVAFLRAIAISKQLHFWPKQIAFSEFFLPQSLATLNTYRPSAIFSVFFPFFFKEKKAKNILCFYSDTQFVVSFKTDSTYMVRKRQRKLIATNFSCSLVVVHTFLFISFFRSVFACKPTTDTVGFQFDCYFTWTEMKFTNESHWIIMRFSFRFSCNECNAIVFALKIFEYFVCIAIWFHSIISQRI